MIYPALETLRTLAAADPKYSDFLLSVADQFEKRGTLTPKQALVVVRKLASHRVGHDPSWFPVDLSTLPRRADLLSMGMVDLAQVYPYLTPEQRGWMGYVFRAPEVAVPMEVI